MSGLPLILGLVLATATAIGFIILLLLKSGVSNRQEHFEKKAKSELADMFIFTDSKTLFNYSAAALVLTPILVYVMFGNPVLAIASGIGVAFAPSFLIKRTKRQRIEKFEKQLPDALLMVSGGMRAGASLSVALESMVKEQQAPLAQEFDLMLREQRLGVDFDTALSNMEKRMPLPDFILLVAAMRITREVGGNFAEILESLAHTLRRKHDMEGKIKALTAQGKLQGIVMALLPAFLCLILTYMEPEAMSPLYNTWMGYGVLTVTTIMLLLGHLLISKIVTIDV
jgi:tight adherence protein B